MKTKCNLCGTESSNNIPFKSGKICEECKDYIKSLPSLKKNKLHIEKNL